jgi:hypothetical protein
LPVALRGYGWKYSKHAQRKEREGFRDIQLYIRDELIPAINAKILELVDKVYDESDNFSIRKWKANEKSFLNQKLPKPYNDFDTWFGKLAHRLQQEGFYDSRKMLIDELKQIEYPVKLYDDVYEPEDEFKKMDFLEMPDKLTKGRFIDQETRSVPHFSYSGEHQWIFNPETLVEVVESREGKSYFLYDEEGIMWVTEGDISVPLGTGKLTPEFKAFLNRQFQQGLDPRNRITTFTTAHVAELQNIFLSDISKGLDPTMTRDKFVRKLLKGSGDKALRKKLEFQSMRILRTSYARSAAASTSLFALRNEKIIESLERAADGRPCMSCTVLDGKRYPPGSFLDDHPMGMCVFVPVVKTLTEMGFDPSKVPPKLRAGFDHQQRGYPLWKEKFYGMPEADQRAIFGNNKLFNLWKSENFPIENLVVQKNGFYVPMSYKEAILKVDKWSTASNPGSKVVNLKDGKTLGKVQSKDTMLRIDPYDNSKGNFIVRADDFPEGMDPNGGLFVKSSNNGNGFGIGSMERFAIEKSNPRLFSEILDMEARYKGAFPRFVQNEMNRKLGLFRRVADDDSIYYVLNRSQMDDLKRIINPPIFDESVQFKIGRGVKFEGINREVAENVFGKLVTADDIFGVNKLEGYVSKFDIRTGVYRDEFKIYNTLYKDGKEVGDIFSVYTKKGLEIKDVVSTLSENTLKELIYNNTRFLDAIRRDRIIINSDLKIFSKLGLKKTADGKHFILDLLDTSKVKKGIIKKTIVPSKPKVKPKVNTDKVKQPNPTQSKKLPLKEDSTKQQFQMELRRIDDEFVRNNYGYNTVEEFQQVLDDWAENIPKRHFNKKVKWDFNDLKDLTDHDSSLTAAGQFSPKQNFIRMAGKRGKLEYLEHTFYHEYAHFLDYNGPAKFKTIKGFRASHRITRRKDWRELTDKYAILYKDNYGAGYYKKFNYPFGTKVIKAGREGIAGDFFNEEFFSQIYAEYIMNSSQLKREMADVYKFMKEEIFRGKEYI